MGTSGWFDQGVPGRAEPVQRLIARWIQVWADPLELHVPVPEIPVQVVRQLGNQGEEREAHHHCQDPNAGQTRVSAARGHGCATVTEQGARGEKEPRDGEGQATGPAERRQDGPLGQTEAEQHPGLSAPEGGHGR